MKTAARPQALQVSDMSVSYERWGQIAEVLRHVSLVVCAGRHVRVIGANGSGKSTLLLAIRGFVPLASGSVEVAGQRTDAMSTLQRSTSMYLVRQDPRLGSAGELTVRENLVAASYGTSTRGGQPRERAAKALSIIEEAGLHLEPGQRADTLSGGQRQVLALAMGISRAVPLVLLDEPYAALDPSRTEACRHLVRSMVAGGQTVIEVSHERNPQGWECDEVLGLIGGKATYLGAPGQLSQGDLAAIWGAA